MRIQTSPFAFFVGLAIFLSSQTVSSGLDARSLGLPVGEKSENPALEGLVKLLSDSEGRQVLSQALQPLLTKAVTEELMEKLDPAAEKMQDEEDSQECRACEVAVTALALAVSDDNTTWDSIRDTVVDICIVILDAVENGTESQIICEGTIDTQGPHVYYIFNQMELPDGPPGLPPWWPPGGPGVTLPAGPPGGPRADSAPIPRDFCETLNVCFPPKTATYKTAGRRLGEKIKKTNSVTKENEATVKRRVTRAERHQRDLDGAVKVVQLTDIHVDVKYAKDSANDCGFFVCCRDSYSGTGEASEWGDYNCNTPQATIDLFLEKVAELEPDFVIYSGDSPPHSIWEETYDSQLECTQILVDSMLDKLDGYNVYPSIGNHEMYPTNLYYTKLNYTQDMNVKFAELWQPLAEFGTDQMETFEKAGYYSLSVGKVAGLRIVNFNSNYWYSGNFYNVLNDYEEDLPEMIAWIRAELDEAYEAGDKVILVGHHPPGHSSTIVKHSRVFTDNILQHNDAVVLHLAGHTHKDHFKLVYDESGLAGHVAYVAPSMDPHNQINPSARVWYLDPETFDVIDYEQYMLDLQELRGKARGSVADPEIRLSYTARKEYGMENLSPQSWHELTERFLEEDELFQKYYQNYYAQTNRPHCDANCKIGYLCAMVNSNYDEVLQCELDNEPPPPGTTTTEPGIGDGGAQNLQAASALILLALLSSMIE